MHFGFYGSINFEYRLCLVLSSVYKPETEQPRKLNKQGFVRNIYGYEGVSCKNPKVSGPSPD